MCDQALALLQPIAERYGLTISIQEIAFKPDLFDRYGVRIPVITFGEAQAELSWPFDLDELDQFISAQLKS